MLQIPEELLKIPEKELIKLLPDNKYRAKYLIYNGTIYEKKAFYKKNTIVKNTISNSISTLLMNDTVFPLTIENINTYKQEKLYHNLKTCSIESFVKYLTTITSEFFDESRFDIRFSKLSDYIELIIYYPEIKITNSHELEHTLKDIYVKYVFGKQERRLDSIRLCRTTYFDYEYLNNYMFSHADNGSLDIYTSSLCFGSTDLSTLISIIKRDTINLRYFSKVLLSFEEYLSWESLEGTPYKYISKLRDNVSKYKVSSCRNYDVNSLLSIVFENFTDFSYRYHLENGKYTIKLNESTIQDIDNLLTSKPELSRYLYYLVNGESCILNSRYERLNTGLLNNKDTEVIFKGEVKKLNIIVSEEKEEIVPEMRIHRNLLNSVITTIENKFTDYIMNKKLEENV